eukprot:gene5222-5878_t
MMMTEKGKAGLATASIPAEKKRKAARLHSFGTKAMTSKVAPAEGIVSEKKKSSCHLTKKSKIIAVLLGIALAAAVILSLYFTGMFSDAPKLPDALEGKASFSSDHGAKEIYGLKIDFTEKIIQFDLLQEISIGHSNKNRRRRDVEEDNKLGMKKIVIQDFKNLKKYILIPGKNSTTKCLKADMKGNMIPQDLLKSAKSEEVSDEMKNRILKRLRFGDNSEADVMASDGNETQNIIYRGHGWNMTMHSKDKGRLNLTDVKNLECFDYHEETNSIDEKFYETDQSKYIIDDLTELQRAEIKNLSQFINNSADLPINNNNANNHVRQRRNILDRLARWSHGNWCGAYTGGYENHCKPHCKAPFDKVHDNCKQCNPTIDELDKHCMEHDRCLQQSGPGPSACLPQGNRCTCDFNLVIGAMRSGTLCASQGKADCVTSSRTIAFVFSNLLSCWFPTDVCFPVIKVTCGCSSCSCPSLKKETFCVKNMKLCVPFGSGKVHW